MILESVFKLEKCIDNKLKHGSTYSAQFNFCFIHAYIVTYDGDTNSIACVHELHMYEDREKGKLKTGTKNTDKKNTCKEIVTNTQ